MPLYRYQALSEGGKKITALLDADTLQEAKQKLIRRQVLVIRIDLLTEKEARKPLPRGEVLSLTRELARLLSAGLPLFEALAALEEKYRGHGPHKILLDLCEKVKTGTAFSKALSAHSSTFDLLYISMVANAEKTGALARCLEELAHLLARQHYVRKQIASALLYPALLATFCLVVLASLLFFVIPSLQELFEGRDLHPFTRIVFAASHFACDFKIPLGMFAFGLGFAGALASFSQSFKAKMSRIYCKLPLVKGLTAKIALTRFSRASATLLEGGVPIIAAFAQARLVMQHSALEKIVMEAEEKIARGSSLAEAFPRSALIPPLIPRMLGIAEQSGKLSFTMQQIAQIYEDELETTLTHFAAAAQPALLLLLGGLVGFVLLSVLLPLTDVSSFAN